MRIQAYVREADFGRDGALDVTISTVNSSVYERGEIDDVPAGTETQVLAYTVAGSTLYLDEVAGTGTGESVWRVYVNGVKKETKRLRSPKGDVRFTYAPFKLAVGDVVAVKVTHTQAGTLLFFEASFKAHR